MLTRCYCCEQQVHFLGTSWNSSYYFVNEEDISTAFCAVLDNNITHLFGSACKREAVEWCFGLVPHFEGCSQGVIVNFEFIFGKSMEQFLLGTLSIRTASIFLFLHCLEQCSSFVGCSCKGRDYGMR
jgi:hypothetical protein